MAEDTTVYRVEVSGDQYDNEGFLEMVADFNGATVLDVERDRDN